MTFKAFFSAAAANLLCANSFCVLRNFNHQLRSFFIFFSLFWQKVIEIPSELGWVELCLCISTHLKVIEKSTSKGGTFVNIFLYIKKHCCQVRPLLHIDFSLLVYFSLIFLKIRCEALKTDKKLFSTWCCVISLIVAHSVSKFIIEFI